MNLLNVVTTLCIGLLIGAELTAPNRAYRSTHDLIQNHLRQRDTLADDGRHLWRWCAYLRAHGQGEWRR
jgi:hypothetical protein